MPDRTPARHEDFFPQLSDRIDSLQNSFHKLAKSGSIEDLGRHFVEIIGSHFPKSSMALFHKAKDAPEWECLIEGSEHELHALQRLPKLPEEKTAETHSVPNGIVLVQRLIDKSLVGIAVSGKYLHPTHTDLDSISLKIFANLFDNAYQEFLFRKKEKAMVFSLNHRILQLNSLIDTGIEVAALDADAAPYLLALERAASLTNASKGTVRIKRGRTIREQYIFPQGASLPKNHEHRIVTKFKFAGDMYSFELFEKESRSGIIPFEETDQLLLDALARQVYAALENKFLHQQALENERIEKEISVAAAIQKKIIPITLPPLEGYDIAGVNIPTKSVGGDYYDGIPLPNGKYALIVADVAGKGIPAALLVSTLHAYLSAYLEGGNTLDRLAGKLNNAIFRTTTDDKFVTAIIAILSPATGELECLNAGHNPGYLLKNDGSVIEVNAGGFPLGMLDIDIGYKSDRLTIEKGERLLLYSDGVTEAENEKEEFYEHYHSLKNFLAHHKTTPAETFIAELIKDIKLFTSHAAQNDDITALCLYRHS